MQMCHHVEESVLPAGGTPHGTDILSAGFDWAMIPAGRWFTVFFDGLKSFGSPSYDTIWRRHWTYGQWIGKRRISS